MASPTSSSSRRARGRSTCSSGRPPAPPRTRRERSLSSRASGSRSRGCDGPCGTSSRGRQPPKPGVMGDVRAEAKEQLGTLIERVMADGKIEPTEREELQAVYRQALLTVSDVKDVLGRYVRAVQDEVLADGKVTDEERKR